MTWSEEGPGPAMFDVEFPHLMLNDGSNHRRAMGERARFHNVQVTNKKGKEVTKNMLKDKVILQIREMGPWRRLDRTAKVGGVISGTAETDRVVGNLLIGDDIIPLIVHHVTCDCVIRKRQPRA